MNYACISDRAFFTKKDLTAKKTLSDEVKARKAYIRSHKFSLNVNPSNQQADVKITKE